MPNVLENMEREDARRCPRTCNRSTRPGRPPALGASPPPQGGPLQRLIPAFSRKPARALKRAVRRTGHRSFYLLFGFLAYLGSPWGAYAAPPILYWDVPFGGPGGSWNSL